MATKSKSIVEPTAKAKQQQPRITATLVSVSDELRYNTKADGSQGQGYYACSLKLDNGKTVSGIIYSAVVDNGVESNDTVSCKVGTVEENGKLTPIVRVLGTGSARPSWEDLGLSAPNLDDAVF